MKKIIIRVVIVLMILIVIAVAAFVVMLTYDPNASAVTITSPTVTDSDGNSYLAVEDGEGVTYAAVTDVAGNIYAAEILPDGSIGEIVADISAQVNLSDLPTTTSYIAQEEGSIVQTTTANSNSTTTNSADNYTTGTDADGSVYYENDGTTAYSTTAASEDSTSTTRTTVVDSSAAYRIDKYQEMFAGGQFLLSFYTEDESLGSEPITAAMDYAGNIVIDVSMDEIGTCQMLYLADKDTTYMIVDKWSKYIELPDSLLEDMNLSEMMDSLKVSSDLGEITVSTFVEDGMTYTQESYIGADGYEVRYIFLNDEWVKRENDNADGTVSTTYVLEATDVIPAGTFDIPSGYTYFNGSWLGVLL
ncbi:MAG: hypothetical protein R3Y27_02860 [Clostridia bacterium]